MDYGQDNIVCKIVQYYCTDFCNRVRVIIYGYLQIVYLIFFKQFSKQVFQSIINGYKQSSIPVDY